MPASDKTILFVTTVSPYRNTTGSEIVTLNFVDALEDATPNMTVIGYERLGEQSENRVNFVGAGQRSIETRSNYVSAIGSLLSAVASGRPYTMQKYVTAALRRAFLKIVEERAPNFVVIDHLQMSWVVDCLPEGNRAKRIMIAHNIEHRLYEPKAEMPGSLVDRIRGGLWDAIGRREALLLHALERRQVERFDQIWTLTGAEADYFRATYPLVSDRVRQFDVPGLAPPDEIEAEVSTRLDVGLIGNWTWAPNRRGLDWFVTEVAPLLPPGIAVTVAGRGGDAAVPEGGAVVAVGRVEDAHEFMSSCRVLVVPSTHGAGVQVKTLDAIQSGVATVVTRHALRGIDDVPSTVRAVDDASGMASAIVDLLDHQTGANRDEVRAWSERRTTEFRRRIRDALTFRF